MNEKDKPEESSVVNKVLEWQGLSDAAMRLRCGEMTAQEIRTVRAVLNNLLLQANCSK